MENDILGFLAPLSDSELIDRLKILVARDRDVTAEIVAHLAELDTRELYLREGFPSLFIYCRDALGLSEWEAYNRIEVARAARRFPVILELLAEGSVSLTAVRLLAPHLNSANHRDVLHAARGKRKADVEEMVARLSPRPDVRCSVRRLPRPPAPCTSEAFGRDAVPGGDRVPALEPLLLGAAARSASAVPRAEVTPLSPDRYRFQVTIGGETLDKIRLAKDILGHAVPSGDDAVILDRAFTALLAELARKKFAQAPEASRASRVEAGGAHTSSATVRQTAARTPSAAVKRAVWLRDLGRCAFIGTGGHRCNERRFVEFHHIDPYALGGEASVDGIQLRCRRHNDYEGRLYFGQRRPARELVPEQVRLSASHST